MMRLVLIFFILLVTASCNPYRFTLLYNLEYELMEGQILSHFDYFEKLNDNSFILKPGGIASIRKPKLTNFQFEANLNYSSELKLNIWLRTITHEFSKDNGIKIEIQSGRLKIFENSREIYSESSNIADNKSIDNTLYFRLISEGKNLFVTMDCNPQIIIKTELLLTEYIIFENLSNEKILMSGIKLQESQKKIKKN